MMFTGTADVGWVTGHSYIVYGPLCNGSTTLMFEGVPTYPKASRFWEIIDKFNVTIFYTAPTAIRALMGLGDTFVNSTSRNLRIIGTVGEPINPEAWKWYYEIVGKRIVRLLIHGGKLKLRNTISPISGVTPLKPGSATLPFYGVNRLYLIMRVMN